MILKTPLSAAALLAVSLTGCLDLADVNSTGGTNAIKPITDTETSPDQRYIVHFDVRNSADPMLRSNGTFSTRSAEQVLQRAANATSVMHLDSLQATVAVLTDEQKALLESDPSVLLVEPDPRRFVPTQAPGLLAESSPYGIAMVQANQLSDAGVGNRSVCIIDSGYDLNHVDLQKTNVTGGNTASSAGLWYQDGNGHGTHVAGTIAALGNNGQGVIGVNPSGLLNLHIVKVFDNSGGWAYGSDLVRAIQQCADAGSQVVSMSLGGPGSSQAERNAMANFAANGMLLIAAAGNDGNNRFSFPASYDSVMSVAAIDRNKNVASFSQYNSQVEIAAPGVGVLSTTPGSNYQSFNGTSMATPHVSGVAALVWSHFPNCSVTEVRSALNSSAQDLGATGRDIYYGHGLVQAKAAYDVLQASSCGGNTPTPPPVGIIDLDNGAVEANLAAQKNDFSKQYRIAVPEGATDFSVTVSGGNGDVDLYVNRGAEPTLTQYNCRPYRWGNNESCVFSQPEAGTWYISLRAYDSYSGVRLEVKYDEPVSSVIRTEINDLSASKGLMMFDDGTQAFTFDVDESMTRLTIATGRGTGDVDLYVRHGDQPTRRVYDCKPFKDGNEEMCEFTGKDLKPGKWYVGLHGYEDFSGVSLIVERE